MSFNTNVLYSCKSVNFKLNACGSKKKPARFNEGHIVSACMIRAQRLLNVQHFWAKAFLCYPSEVTDRGYLLLKPQILELCLAIWSCWVEGVYEDKETCCLTFACAWGTLVLLVSQFGDDFPGLSLECLLQLLGTHPSFINCSWFTPSSYRESCWCSVFLKHCLSSLDPPGHATLGWTERCMLILPQRKDDICLKC